MIKGIHHVALRCIDMDNYRETLDFYENVIGMKVRYSWGDGDFAATMLELNGDVIEIFSTGRASGETGTINHFCFETDDPTESALKVLKAGYSVIVPPSNVRLRLNDSEKEYLSLTYAYCVGPVGEVIEFYKELDD